MTLTLSAIAKAIQASSVQAFGSADPSTKLDPVGYLNMLSANKVDSKRIMNLIDDGSGYIRKVVIKYRQRDNDPGSTVDDCLTDPAVAPKTMEINSLLFRKKAITLEDDLIAQLDEPALAIKRVGQPAAPVLTELWDTIMAGMPGLIDAMDKDLISLQSARWGRHVSTQSAAAKTINFPLNATNNDLTTGYTAFENDMMQNGVNPRGIQLVGNGLMNAYFIQQKAKSADQSGLDTSRLLLPGWNYDLFTTPLWGANRVGVFEQGAVQFIQVCRYRGSKTLSPTSYFGTLRMPYNDYLGNNVGAFLEFDFQLFHRDCPDLVQIGPVGESNPPQLLGRGWTLIISTHYNQVNIPTDAYTNTDRLYGTNGTYLYNVTNA